MRINITMSKAKQDAICQRCPWAKCIGIESRQCLIQVEQRKIWRKDYARRKEAGYFAQRNARIKAARTVQQGA